MNEAMKVWFNVKGIDYYKMKCPKHGIQAHFKQHGKVECSVCNSEKLDKIYLEGERLYHEFVAKT